MARYRHGFCACTCVKAVQKRACVRMCVCEFVYVSSTDITISRGFVGVCTTVDLFVRAFWALRINEHIFLRWLRVAPRQSMIIFWGFKRKSQMVFSHGLLDFERQRKKVQEEEVCVFI
jgi:hypothetical protein